MPFIFQDAALLAALTHTSHLADQAPVGSLGCRLAAP